ncbi:MAG TPA: hypothetical protein ENK19_08695 [Acidobacteria bacterium]|nr:hypothetical protein [Acidobacteriota bacterium]
MKPGWLHRLTGFGKIPPVVRETLEDEGFVFLDEGVRITVHYRSYRAPGKRAWHKLRRVRGAIALTEQRLIAFAYFRKVLNVRLDDPRLARLGLGLAGPGVLEITVDPSVFHPDRSGEVVYRFQTVHAEEILAVLEEHRRR